MKMFKKILPFIGLLALATTTLKADPSLELSLLPPMPFDRTAMAEPDYRTGICFSDLSNVKAIANTPVNKIQPGLFTLAPTLPLFSIDLVDPNGSTLDERLDDNNSKDAKLVKKTQLSYISASSIVSTEIKFPNINTINYGAKLEEFFNSPWLDQKFSDGNRLYLDLGLERIGSMDLSGIGDKTPSEIVQNLYNGFGNYTNLLAHLYIVAHGYGKYGYDDPQYAIFEAGFDDLLDSTKRNFNASITLRAPIIKNISPFISLYMSTLLKDMQTSNNGDEIISKEYGFCGKLGLDIWGESGKSIVPYVQIDNGGNAPNSVEFSGGLDLNL
jgi:hypothetical protein